MSVSAYPLQAADIKSVGKGAFGSVYEVEDKDGNRYALKVLLPDVKDNISYLSCFRRGIRSMGILKERGIEGMVQIHDSYEVPACIIMDYVDGITLRGVIKYFHKYKEKAMAAVSDELFIAKSGYSSEQGIQIELSTFLPETLNLDYIDSVANNIAEVRRLLDN